MARQGRSSVAFVAAAVVGGLLVLVELIVRQTAVADQAVRTPSSLVSEVLATTLSVDVSGWPALAAPVVVVFLLGLVIDATSGIRR